MSNSRRPIVQRLAPISEQLRSFISARDLTPCAIAISADVAPSVVTRFVNRERGLTLDSLDRIAGFLGLGLVEVSRRRKVVKGSEVSAVPLPLSTSVETSDES